MLAEPGDCVFVDEIHELPPTVQTTLYRCLEERRLFLGGVGHTNGGNVLYESFEILLLPLRRFLFNDLQGHWSKQAGFQQRAVLLKLRHIGVRQSLFGR